MPLQTLPLRIGQIIWINGTHPFNLSHEFLLPFPENGQKLFPEQPVPICKTRSKACASSPERFV
jgi:hypothetical protein